MAVTVIPVDDATNVTGGTSGVGAEDAATISGTLTATDVDGLSDGSVFSVTGGAAHGTASIDAGTGAWSYTPVADYNGSDSFTVTITDDANNTTTQVIALTVNAAADIVNDTASTGEDPTTATAGPCVGTGRHHPVHLPAPKTATHKHHELSLQPQQPQQQAGPLLSHP